MEKMKSCGNCAEACGIEGKNEVVGCKEDGKLHNAQEQKACFYVNDCDTCVHKYMYRGDVEACHRRDAGLDCQYKEREVWICHTCEKEVYRDEMEYTRDCHGIIFRMVCWDCYRRLMAKGYDGEYYDEADEQIEDDY